MSGTIQGERFEAMELRLVGSRIRARVRVRASLVHHELVGWLSLCTFPERYLWAKV